MKEQDEKAGKGFPISSAYCPYREYRQVIGQALGAMLEMLESGSESGSSNCNKSSIGQPVRFVVIKARDRQQGIVTGGDSHD